MTPLLFAEIPFPGWNPVALHLGPVQLRWYGLAYLLGFIVTGYILDLLSKRGYIALTKRQVSDLVGWLVVGVIVGGRLGYAVFYQPSLLRQPLKLLEVWHGGLSFHGGLALVILLSLWFARRHGIQWRRLGDAMVLAAPIGIFLVRCANFINAELYGRVAPASLPWAMRFPTDPAARLQSPALAAGFPLHWHEAFVQLRATGEWQRIAPQVPLRHPSQLYEALLEGALVAAILWIVYLRRGEQLKPGRIGALFLALYGTARFLVEFTRQPDPQLGFVLGPFSMGQLLSVGVLIAAAVMYRWPARDSNVRSSTEPNSVL